MTDENSQQSLEKLVISWVPPDAPPRQMLFHLQTVEKILDACWKIKLVSVDDRAVLKVEFRPGADLPACMEAMWHVHVMSRLDCEARANGSRFVFSKVI